MQKFAILAMAAGSIAAAAPAQAQYAQPSGGPLSTIFSCQNANNRQGQGALVGALVGGFAGNQMNDKDRTTGTVIGALVGAAAGSMIGCRMQSQDVQRAQTTTQQALASGRSQTWTNPQTGASGAVQIIDTYNYGAQPLGGGYNQAGYGRPSLSTVRWIAGVEQPREYQPSEGSYQANGQAIIRSGPSQRARQIGTLRGNDRFDGLVRIEGTDWVLASRDNQILGYVQESQTRFLGDTYAMQPQQQPGYGQQTSGGYPQQPLGDGYADYPDYQPGRGQMCRVFDQSYTDNRGQPSTQRFTACQTAGGEWVVQS